MTHMQVFGLTIAVDKSQPEWREQALASLRYTLDQLEGKPDEAWKLIEIPDDATEVLVGVRFEGA